MLILLCLSVDEPDCPSCNQAHTCENIVDHFCRADFGKKIHKFSIFWGDFMKIFYSVSSQAEASLPRGDVAVGVASRKMV